MTVAEARKAAIAEALDDVRAIEAHDGVTRKSLDKIKQRMMRLAARRELFPAEEFALKAEDNGEKFDVLSVDDDGRFELYIEVADKAVEAPPHDHTTWAVVVGIEGAEVNRIYDVDAAHGTPPTLREEVSVGPGTGVALMPEDFHSIHIAEGVHNMHLHLYGLCFAKLKGRTKFDAEKGQYRQFDMAIE
jgi:predicted metal-dependent enzyme (double-stranded beta helix superfamily)